jgi:hypothetical protein
MAYSRKSYWMFRGAMFAIVAAWLAFLLLGRPGGAVVPYFASAVMLACLVLTFRSFLYLDEIEQARRMRVCFYGFLLGTFATAIALTWIMLQPSVLDSMADILHRHSPHRPFEYFVLGVLMTMLAQIVCALLTSLFLRLKPSA